MSPLGGLVGKWFISQHEESGFDSQIYCRLHFCMEILHVFLVSMSVLFRDLNLEMNYQVFNNLVV